MGHGAASVAPCLLLCQASALAGTVMKSPRKLHVFALLASVFSALCLLCLSASNEARADPRIVVFVLFCQLVASFALLMTAQSMHLSSLRRTRSQPSPTPLPLPERWTEEERPWERFGRRDAVPHRAGLLGWLAIVNVPMLFLGIPLFGLAASSAASALGTVYNLVLLRLAVADLSAMNLGQMDRDGRTVTSLALMGAIIALTVWACAATLNIVAVARWVCEID